MPAKGPKFQARAARERTAILKAEWTLQNDPMRLKQLADKFLVLKPVTPDQFTTLAELDKRLPPPRDPNANPNPSPPEMTDQKPAASETPDVATSTPPQIPQLKPVDSKPEEAKPIEARTTGPKPASTNETEPPRLRASRDIHAKSPTHLPEHTQAVAGAAPVVTRSTLSTPALPRPVAAVVAQPPRAPVAPASMVSALGMARTVLAPPMPVPQAEATMAPDGN